MILAHISSNNTKLCHFIIQLSEMLASDWSRALVQALIMRPCRIFRIRYGIYPECEKYVVHIQVQCLSTTQPNSDPWYTWDARNAFSLLLLHSPYKEKNRSGDMHSSWGHEAWSTSGLSEQTLRRILGAVAPTGRASGPQNMVSKSAHRFLGLLDFVHDDLQWAILMCTSQPYANENYFFHEIWVFKCQK